MLCSEVVLDQVTPPEAAPALMGLAFAPDGTLYLARTAAGEIWTMRDADGDQFLDAPQPLVGGLTLPTGIAFYDGALYAVSMGGVLRLDDTDGDGVFDARTVLVSDLPVDTGFWPGSVGIGPDRRLYVSLGAPCNDCAQVQARRGVLLSYALDGSDEQIVASGLRSPADFAWNPADGALWVLDSARMNYADAAHAPPDELNRVEPNANFGFPYCEGDRQPNPALTPPAADFCAQTAAPTRTFPVQSSPAGLAFYDSDTIPVYRGVLLVALGGSWSLPEPSGYTVEIIAFKDGEPDGTSRLAPILPRGENRYTLVQASLWGRGFFPDHPADVVISPEGWIYVSVQEGQIFRYRPRPQAG
jgi:glucose/arabinose dehydrogenase